VTKRIVYLGLSSLALLGLLIACTPQNPIPPPTQAQSGATSTLVIATQSANGQTAEATIGNLGGKTGPVLTVTSIIATGPATLEGTVGVTGGVAGNANAPTNVVGVQSTIVRQGAAGPESTSEVADSAGVPGSSIGTIPTPTNGAPGNGGGTASVTGNSAQATMLATGAATLAANQINPCNLVTRADVETAYGAAFKDPTLAIDPNSGVATCQYLGASSNSVSVGISVFQGEAQANVARQSMGQSAQTVSGLGDEAAFVKSGLYVRKGNVYISVGVANPDHPEKANDIAQAIAQRILAKGNL